MDDIYIYTNDFFIPEKQNSNNILLAIWASQELLYIYPISKDVLQ